MFNFWSAFSFSKLVITWKVVASKVDIVDRFDMERSTLFMRGLMMPNSKPSFALSRWGSEIEIIDVDKVNHPCCIC